jgi:HSP20 family molecular chaperone IbpA
MISQSNVIEVKRCDTPEKMKEVIVEELRRDFEEWMTTNRDEVWRPRIELTKVGEEFVARVLLPGVDPGDIEVMVAADALLIKGETTSHRRLLSSLKFPQPVDPNKVHVVMNDGLLSIRAEMVRATRVLAFRPKAA